MVWIRQILTNIATAVFVVQLYTFPSLSGWKVPGSEEEIQAAAAGARHQDPRHRRRETCGSSCVDALRTVGRNEPRDLCCPTDGTTGWAHVMWRIWERHRGEYVWRCVFQVWVSELVSEWLTEWLRVSERWLSLPPVNCVNSLFKCCVYVWTTLPLLVHSGDFSQYLIKALGHGHTEGVCSWWKTSPRLRIGKVNECIYMYMLCQWFPNVFLERPLLSVGSLRTVLLTKKLQINFADHGGPAP